MIEIHFEVCPPVGKRQHYQLFVDHKNLSTALEMVNQFVRDAYILQSICLWDGGLCTPLPVGAFDGQAIGVHLRALQQEWQELLGIT